MAEPQCPRHCYTNCPTRRRRKRREMGQGQEQFPTQSGPLGLGGSREGAKYLCSHLNVNQVWLERGSRDTEERGESESPTGKKRQRWGW